MYHNEVDVKVSKCSEFFMGDQLRRTGIKTLFH